MDQKTNAVEDARHSLKSARAEMDSAAAISLQTRRFLKHKSP